MNKVVNNNKYLQTYPVLPTTWCVLVVLSRFLGMLRTNLERRKPPNLQPTRGVEIDLHGFKPTVPFVNPRECQARWKGRIKLQNKNVRHSWCIRSIFDPKFSDGLAARSAGHALSLHTSTYATAIEKRDMEEQAELLRR